MYYVEEGLIRIINNILNEVKEKEPEIKFKNEVSIHIQHKFCQLKKTEHILDFEEYAMINSLWMSKFFGFTQNEVKMLCKKLIDNEKIDSNNNKHKKRNGMLKKHMNNKERKCKENINNKELVNTNNISEKQKERKKDLTNKKKK
ncbi:hypothetical protein LY90DRAFT_506248 [Neocallimastix californiae]|uniref:Uncharacterized protein n=1 Tax=Neocallimastix californiae TaxID=1754190 RepID=A0A1Y2DG75_9FUNG|nr:hypothetical protein LY90DRAFT_506248 [Neocallimastix californiae]|eukprot:ORY58258.1 hypothetical protein LY90DRAFT_506248 [Neocallimastix californiae]